VRYNISVSIMFLLADSKSMPEAAFKNIIMKAYLLCIITFLNAASGIDLESANKNMIETEML
jgi:hypothetical protein